ncbi:M1 family metallopeptidase [Polyangium sorediatum]|uniref:M1 family aminopeptidase n=1 Tax=Polyangium sorediatum TaxID=889274 RepID=A0ABT6NU13_9BACT|nr:M1 family aminopeptidase [Polyangium sorediatum]MDI1431823.1 M1 family aminopeptidase [Polyangium sorediatum]
MRFPSRSFRHTPRTLFVGLTALVLLAAGCSDDPASNCGVAGCGEGGTGGAGGAGGAGGMGGMGPTGDITANVVRYDYTFDLVTAEAQSKLALDVAEPGGDCYSVSCEASSLTDVTWNEGPAASADFANNALKTCGPGVPAGPTLTVGARTTVSNDTYWGLDVGFSRKKDLAGGDFSYLLSWVGGCDRFGPCDDDPSRMSDFHFEVTHPAGTVVLCPGTLTAGDTKTTCDVTNAPTYSAFAIAADPLWERAPYGSFAGVDLVFYEVPLGTLAASLDKASVGAFMDWITALLGPFPYGKELRIAGGPTAWLGFEHPANIILHQQLDKLQTDYADAMMHVLMHEIVHQWAGDHTTLASAADFVWKEATAEYLGYVFEDLARPEGEAAATRAYWDGVSPLSKHWPRPTDEPAPEVQDFYGDVYGPGPMVLYLQLEPLIGRDAVLAGIADFLSKSGGRSVTELKEALEAASGQDLDAYFDAWVFGKGAPVWPTFAVSATQLDGQATITVTQQNPNGKLFPCVVEVEIKGATETARVGVDFGLAPQDATATMQIPFSEAVATVTLDPDHRLIGTKAGAQPITAARPVWIF